MKNHVYWLLQVAVKDGQLDNLRSLMTEMSTATQNDEPGTLNYEWWIGDDEKTIHIYERYADSGAAIIHVGNFGSKFMERFMGAADPTAITVYGDASPELREALAGFGAVHMGAFGGFTRG